MRALKIVAGLAVALACLYGLGRLFLAELSHGPAAPDGPPGVVLAAPPEYAVTEGGEQSRQEAARQLADLLARSRQEQVGLHFTSGGFELYWLADRGGAQGGTLTERSAGPSGVRTETVWHGDLAVRLAWAEEHGTPDAPALPAGERKNLYH
jgi:hypothetical protein